MFYSSSVKSCYYQRITCFQETERKSRYKSNFQCMSLCRQVCLWKCRALFLQRAFQFGFLNTVETLTFFSLKSSLEFVSHCENFISFLASPPASALYYSPKYKYFHANCTVVFVLFFFSKSGVRNNAKYAFQYTFKHCVKMTLHNMQKRRRRKERKNIDLHDHVCGGSPIQFLTPPERA